MLVLSPRFAVQNFRGILKEMRAENPDKNEDDAGCRFGTQRFTPPNLPKVPTSLLHLAVDSAMCMGRGSDEI